MSSVYLPKDDDELGEILESLRIYASTHGMVMLGELLGDAELVLAMEKTRHYDRRAAEPSDESLSH
jgi:hypothetical protein